MMKRNQRRKKSEKAENNKKQKRNPKATTNVDEGNWYVTEYWGAVYNIISNGE